ncbi:conserved hypothetical protein [Ruegeria lacuscaerulensis ITI-1157]|nr:conserved hypothetical protein [Ruegeria lacuscaerulensis ITI-1157]
MLPGPRLTNVIIMDTKNANFPSKRVLLTRRVRKRIAKSDAARFLSVLRARLKGHEVRTWLLISDGKAYTSEQQFAPLIRHRQRIASQTGVTFRFKDISGIDDLNTADLSGVDVIGIKLSFTTSPETVETLGRQLASLARNAKACLVIFDGDDDLCVQWPSLIEESDIYLKKHRFSKDADYKLARVGKSNLTDYAHRTYGVSFTDDIIPNSGPLTEAAISKIVLGWNIALDDKIVDLAEDIGDSAFTAKREIDLLCRASVGSDVWTYGMREAPVRALNAMADRYSVLAPTDRVPQEEYYREILSARLTVSPFGFGELCWRDFEAILCGSLLVKPDMSHVQTWPDIFVPHETYVPVSWDFSDLEEVCAPYLADESKRLRLVEAARVCLLDSLKPQSFLNQFVSLENRVAAIQRSGGLTGGNT